MPQKPIPTYQFCGKSPTKVGNVLQPNPLLGWRDVIAAAGTGEAAMVRTASRARQFPGRPFPSRISRCRVDPYPGN